MNATRLKERLGEFPPDAPLFVLHPRCFVGEPLPFVSATPSRMSDGEGGTGGSYLSLEPPANFRIPTLTVGEALQRLRTFSDEPVTNWDATHAYREVGEEKDGEGGVKVVIS